MKWKINASLTLAYHRKNIQLFAKSKKQLLFIDIQKHATAHTCISFFFI